MKYYHYTSRTNLSSILCEGLIPGKGVSPYYKQPYVPAVKETVIWLDTKLYKRPTTSEWVAVEVDSKYLKQSKLRVATYNKRWRMYEGTIPPEAIKYVAR